MFRCVATGIYAPMETAQKETIPLNNRFSCWLASRMERQIFSRERTFSTELATGQILKDLHGKKNLRIFPVIKSIITERSVVVDENGERVAGHATQSSRDSC
jgi:hypothetical protein